MKQRFIEYDLPLAEISEQSAREKNIRHGHPSTLHIWWARRPLASSRATALAALLDDPGPDQPEKREEIRRLIKEITPWEAVKDGNSPAIRRAQALIREQYGDDPPRVLDPFAGGGSIPLEALRLGCETYASDYNPVAVFIEKATLEWPQKFGIEVKRPAEGEDTGDLSDLRRGGGKVNLLAYLVERWANHILDEARAEIGRFYPKESGEGLVGKRDVQHTDGWIPVGYLWARTIPCQNPGCGAEIPLIRQFWLAKKDNKRIAYRPIVVGRANRTEFELLEGSALRAARQEGFDPSHGTVSQANAECIMCGQVTKAKDVRALAGEGRMGQRLVAVVLHHPNETGKKYRLAVQSDEEVFHAAADCLERKLAAWPYLDSPLPGEEIEPLRGVVKVPIYGMTRFKDLFNARQQLALVTFLERLRTSYEAIEEECHRILARNDDTASDLDPAVLARVVAGYVALILDRTADYTSRLSRWANHGEYVGNTLTRQALAMTWDYFETSPISGSGGDWLSQRNWVLRYIENNGWRPARAASVRLASATELPFADDSLDAILTDPPYYYSVTYADLSDFFYVWLKRAIGELFPEFFATPLTPKSKEIIEGAFWDRDRYPNKDGAFFERELTRCFVGLRRALKPGGIAVIVYAHKTTEGWEAMLGALVAAGLVVTGSWPVHTEMKSRLIAARSAALASSIYMVCRKADRDAVGFWDDIRPRVKERVEEKLAQFWESGIVGGDFFISAIGPGMESYSRYERVETYDEEPVTVLDLLSYIRSVATDFLVHRLLRDASVEAIDKESQFYLTYRWTFMDNRVEYDDARKIASAEGVQLESLWGEGGFVRKTAKYVEVLGPKAREPVKGIENMVDAMHRGCQLWERGRRDEVAEALSGSGYADSNAFWQFCQAVAECLTNGNKEKQLLEGLLMGRGSFIADEPVEAQASLDLD